MENVLKKYEFDKARLEVMFPKRHTPRKHVHVSHATHAHTHQTQHAHTHHTKHATHTKHAHVSHAHHIHTHHAFIYGRVYSCTCCGWNSHLVKFCFDRINASNDHVWVRKTNTIGSKKIWVPKLTNFLLDIGTHQGTKT